MSKKPVPSKKQCPSSSRSRRSKWAYTLRTKWEKALQLHSCPSCGEKKRAHFSCMACGQYNGRQVYETRASKRDAQRTQISA
ncbi:50S ribosomal protein L32 [Candidatus Peribacteria bacterium]|nr:50S ribosomal protein L32 [Candidatus Peribacteria bacterium]